MRYMIAAILAIAIAFLQPPMANPQAERHAEDHNSIDTRHATFDISSLNGVPVSGRTNARPGLDYEAAVSVTVEHKLVTMHRVIVDRSRGFYFGYDLVVERVTNQPLVHLHFAPLSSLETFKGIQFDSLSPGASPAPLQDKTVDFNAHVAIPLENAQDGTALITDELRFGGDVPASLFHARKQVDFFAWVQRQVGVDSSWSRWACRCWCWDSRSPPSTRST
ncbi:MAG: hypothetical protein M3R43_03015 [Acidobacteriota bacterium]|nr:hypothetical protein [Acidobacteriota bacterium]